MDSHGPDQLHLSANKNEIREASTLVASNGEFLPGSVLIYGIHGKCEVRAIESRSAASETVRFYKLEILKSTLSRSTKQSPAIWVPVNKAKEQGLRAPLSSSEVAAVMQVLESREYYFDIKQPWHTTQGILEAAVRTEGAIGLAKAYSYLAVLKKKMIVLPPDITRFAETIQKNLNRELSEATSLPIRTIEERAHRAMRHKLLPDH